MFFFVKEWFWGKLRSPVKATTWMLWERDHPFAKGVLLNTYCQNGMRHGGQYWQLEWLITLFPFHTQQTHLLLSWQPDDGSADRAIQGALLDLEQLMGGIQHGEWSQMFSFYFSFCLSPLFSRSANIESSQIYLYSVFLSAHHSKQLYRMSHNALPRASCRNLAMSICNNACGPPDLCLTIVYL